MRICLICCAPASTKRRLCSKSASHPLAENRRASVRRPPICVGRALSARVRVAALNGVAHDLDERVRRGRAVLEGKTHDYVGQSASSGTDRTPRSAVQSLCNARWPRTRSCLSLRPGTRCRRRGTRPDHPARSLPAAGIRPCEKAFRPCFRRRRRSCSCLQDQMSGWIKRNFVCGNQPIV